MVPRESGAAFGTVFFFAVSTLPPTPTLFPYTTLFRSDEPALSRARRDHAYAASRDRPVGARRSIRSEEHTSELQSLTNLVCRLLLEKKKREMLRRCESAVTPTTRLPATRGSGPTRRRQ